MMQKMAGMVRELADRYKIPIVFLRAADLRQGKRGITTHYECSQAFTGDHWDPGPGYPMATLLEHVAGSPGPLPPSTPRPKGVAVYDPPLQIRSYLARPAGGSWGLMPDGGIAGMGAPYRGGVNGKDYFANMVADHLEFPTTPDERKQAASKGWGLQDCYVTVTTDGHRYGPIY
jgi:hypothetical protein